MIQKMGSGAFIFKTLRCHPSTLNTTQMPLFLKSEWCGCQAQVLQKLCELLALQVNKLDNED